MMFAKFKNIAFLLVMLTIISCSGNKEQKENESVLKKKRFEPSIDVRIREEADKGGFVLGGKRSKGGSFDFATSNPLWKASLEVLDFIPLSNIDYAGGIIITDWYQSATSDDSIKLTVRFLSDELKTTSIKVLAHKKKCSGNNCAVTKMDDEFSDKIKNNILTKAREISLQSKK
jgi:hypothetical protein